MDFIIVRHGHRADKSNTYDGGANPALSEMGQRQAEHVARRIANLQPTALYCSTMRRALQTVAPASLLTGMTVSVWPILCETVGVTWGFRSQEVNDLAGKTIGWPMDSLEHDSSAGNEQHLKPGEGNYYLLREIPELFPNTLLDQPFPWPEMWWHGVNWQTVELCTARMQLAVQAIIARHQPNDTVVLVVHGDCGELMLNYLLDIPLRQDLKNTARRFRSRTASFSHVKVKQDGNNVLHAVNCVAHLPEDLIE